MTPKRFLNLLLKQIKERDTVAFDGTAYHMGKKAAFAEIAAIIEKYYKEDENDRV